MHYTGNEQGHRMHPLDQFTITGDPPPDPQWAPTEPAPILPWHEEPAAVTAPQTVVNNQVPSQESPVHSHRHKPRRRLPLAWLGGLVILVGWVALINLVVHAAIGHRKQPTTTVTVTTTPVARPGPRTTIRVPGPTRVVTHDHRVTVRTTVTRRIPGPRVTVTKTTTPPVVGGPPKS